MNFSAIFLGAALLAGGPAIDEGYDEITMCRPSVSDFVQQANASFTIMNRLEVGPGGKAQKVKRIKDWQDVGAMTTCLGSWRLGSFDEGEVVLVALTWQHSKGWVQMVVASEDRKLTLKLEPEVNPPYSRPLPD